MNQSAKVGRVESLDIIIDITKRIQSRAEGLKVPAADEINLKADMTRLVECLRDYIETLKD